MRAKTAVFFESKVRREAVNEDGMQAKIQELYCVDAVSFTECEARVTDYMASFTQGEFEVLTETRAAYKEIFFSEDTSDDKFYKVKADFITIDERTEKQKRTKYVALVQAASVDGAKKNFDEAMKSTMVDYNILAISETAIMDVIEYVKKD